MIQPLLSIIASWLYLSTLCSTRAVPTIQTTSGKLIGFAVSNSTTNAYLGIPFALPPVGQLRFAAPRPLYAPNVVRNATKFSPACVQLRPSYPSPSGESEDCLYLNVWTSPVPTARLKLKPVFVWIYGGGFNAGSTSASLNDFTIWASAHPEIVFVSINYRLNLFGFPDTPAIMPPDTNAGLRDQRAAIEWVYKNIAAFGGDPTHIVLGGQSAGSVSTSDYLYAHPYDSLLKGAIMMSGQAPLQATPPLIPISGVPNQGPNPFPGIAEAVGCPLSRTNSSTPTRQEYLAQLYCMRQKNATQLMDAVTQLNVLGFGPTVDNQTAFTVSEYKSRGRTGRFAKVPLLTGTVDNEGDSFVIDWTTSTLNLTLSEMFTLSWFRCYDSWQSSFSLSAGVPTYRYRYLAQFPSLTYPPLRVWHTSDQIVLFGMIPTEPEKSAMVYLQKAWSAFIVDPGNGLKSQLGWPLYKGYQGDTLVGIFKNNDVSEHPVQVENPTVFDSGCAALGLGL
ncbi:hypothetical protein FRC14_001858 [Serendipita sp. 396]|nr:hypothetical protein FRC14_001858 [Serendipita sp. 396]KAG8798423.1 hypothetical protein FRC16_007289 [Serendipita sp. 398]KAG8866828.1 hypothetical protein FRC20_007400 [Serendipita sp. 405]